MKSKHYSLFVWESGHAGLSISGAFSNRPDHEFGLQPNGTGFDIHEADHPFDMPVTTVPDLPAALAWAMTIGESE